MRIRPGMIADVASLVLNPSLWTGVLFVALTLRFEDGSVAVASVSVLFSTVLPILTLFALVALGTLDTVEMRVRSQRLQVYAICLLEYVAGAFVLFEMGTGWQLWGLMAMFVPNTAVMALLTLRWKVSIHTSVMAGLCVAAIWFFGWPAAVWLLILPPTAWARWAAGAHSTGQLAAGLVYGATSSALGLSVLHVLFAT